MGVAFEGFDQGVFFQVKDSGETVGGTGGEFFSVG
jgi:hypothetical protein